MSLTYAEARDEMLALFLTYWNANASGPPPVEYWDQVVDPKAEAVTEWARVTVRHNTGGNDALGNRLRARAGIVTVQVFTTFGDGLSTSDALAKVATDAFHGKSTSGGVWFRNVRLNEIGRDGKWFQVNVVADFEYNEVV